MFNEICINEEMLPKYTYIYIYILFLYLYYNYDGVKKLMIRFVNKKNIIQIEKFNKKENTKNIVKKECRKYEAGDKY